MTQKFLTAALVPSALEEYEANLARASATQLELARALQRLVFPDHLGEFKPAPLYLRQALAITDDADVCRELLHVINRARLAILG